tara:strand:- start:1053 stop:1247 length:195 start_codon:yes stop_codon:yes gene_type:complete
MSKKPKRTKGVVRYIYIIYSKEGKSVATVPFSVPNYPNPVQEAMDYVITNHLHEVSGKLFVEVD